MIEGCGYNPEVHILSFHHKNMVIVVERNSIFIKNVKDEAEVRAVIEWLAELVNDIDEKEMRLENLDA